MRCLVASLPPALLLAACSPSSAPPADNQRAPSNIPLGSPAWYAWVDRSPAFSDNGHRPNPGSDEWNQAVQHKLAQEAPQSKPGAPAWQQSVDAPLRTRVPPGP